jgi:hypothetical protein
LFTASSGSLPMILAPFRWTTSRRLSRVW